MPNGRDKGVEPMPGTEVSHDLHSLGVELAERRFTSRSANGRVAATVSGDGFLLDITVATEALRGSHPAEVGPAVVQAVREARAEAGRFAVELTRAVLHGEPRPAEPRDTGPRDTEPRVAEPSQAPRRAPRPVEDDAEELFTGFRAGGVR
jgi:DNA-binding protein YbaB